MTQHNGIQAVSGKQYVADTEKKHIFWIENFLMTISYLMASSSQMESEFPRYILESSDGSYRQERSVGGDLCNEGHYMQLRFEKLKPGKSYKLTRYIAEDFAEVVFENAPFNKIVDQDRPAHKVLEDHAYGEFQLDTGARIAGVKWGAEPSLASKSGRKSRI